MVFENQVTLDRAMSAIKNDSDSVVEIKTLDCQVETKFECENLNLTKTVNGTRLFFKQTVNVEVNCPSMEFGSFPFDTQVCNFHVKDLKLKESKDSILKNFQWEAPQLIGAGDLTSPEYDISVEEPSVSGHGASRSNIQLIPFTKFIFRSGFKVKMERKRTVYIYTYFLPCSLMVMVSWVSFAVRADAVPGRFSFSTPLSFVSNFPCQAWPSAHPPPDDDQLEQQRHRQHPHL